MHPPLEDRTLPIYFREEILEKYAGNAALVCMKEHPRTHGGPVSRNMGVMSHLAWDFHEFNKHIYATAGGLISLGVQKGDRVGVIMGNNRCMPQSLRGILLTVLQRIRVTAVGMCEHRCNLGHTQSCIPVDRARKCTQAIEDRLICGQVNALNVAGVSHLFVVPRIKTSRYVRSLADAFPDLRNSSPGNIRAESIPSLRNLVVVNDMSDIGEYSKEILDTECIVDFRETLVWHEDSSEHHRVRHLIGSLRSDEVINLQFTRYATAAPPGYTHITSTVVRLVHQKQFR